MRHLSATLSRSERITHGFFTRQGGVSEGLYASLNCGPGSQDTTEAVAENRRRVQAALGASHLQTLYQIHSAEVIRLTAPLAEKPKADALVTNQPGLAIGILTADCGPVLFADEAAGVIGAAHAGWKGATGGVLQHTLDAMETLGAQRARIVAVLGPTIAQVSYEVGAEFYDMLCALDTANEAFFIASDTPARKRFDLPGYIRASLRQSGVTSVEDLAIDTYSNEAEYFSYRRTTHRSEPDYGRQISAIMIRE